MQEVSDQEILTLFDVEATREKAFRLLIDKYSRRLYFQIRRIVNNHTDTDDVLQNVYIKVWKHLGNFRADAQLYTWLYRIAYNEAMTYMKQQQKHMAESLENRHDQAGAETQLTGEEIQQKLQLAIQQLPDKQKQVFNMRYYDELTYEQMSEVLGTSIGALKASYHHAVKKIEAFLTGH